MRPLHAASPTGPRLLDDHSRDRLAQDGILHQELYIDTRVFNRRHYRKHPDTGKRSSILNPPEDWSGQPARDLRIIDAGLWERVQRRKADLSALPAAHGRKPKRLLSGLMKCDQYGSAMTLKGGKYICSAHYDGGSAICTNSKIIAATTVERRVLAGMKTHLVSPQGIAMAVTRYREAAEEHRHMFVRDQVPLEKELFEIGQRLERAQVMFMVGLVNLDTLKARTAPPEARRQELEALLSATAPPTVPLHLSAAEAYQRMVEDLQQAMEGDAGEVSWLLYHGARAPSAISGVSLSFRDLSRSRAN